MQRAVGHCRELQRTWPIPQQRAATHCRPRHNSELQRSIGLALVVSCNVLPASPQRCVARSCSAASPLAIVATATELCSSDFHPTSVRHPFCVLRLDVRHTVVIRVAPYLPDVLRNSVLQSCVLYSTHYGRASCGVVSCSLSCCILTYYRPVIREIQTIHCVIIL